MKFTIFSAITFATATATATSLPDPSKVTVESITYGGTGCPQGTVSNNLNSDRTQFTLLFDEYIASVGKNVPVAESRKNCQLNVALRIPYGWQYSIGTVDYRGYSKLDPGVVGAQAASYYFQGDLHTGRKQTNFFGPSDEPYVISDSFPVDSNVWSSCGAKENLNINSVILVSSNFPGAEGMLTVDSIDGKLAQTYGFTWQTC